MNLFEINAQIMNCVDTETGEIVDIDKLMQLTLEKKMTKLIMLPATSRTLKQTQKHTRNKKSLLQNVKRRLKRKLKV